MYSAYVLVLTVFHEVAELFVPDPAIGAVVEVHHSLDLLPSEVGHAATANHQSTDKLHACMQKSSVTINLSAYIMYTICKDIA